MTRLPKRYFKSISDYVKTYYTAYGAQRAQKLYDAVKTVTKDFTRTDPVYVRIGEDGEPEIHYAMTQADGSSYFAAMDLGDATLVLHNTDAITSMVECFKNIRCKTISIASGSFKSLKSLSWSFAIEINAAGTPVAILPEEISVPAGMTSADCAFHTCGRVKRVPLFDTSSVTTAYAMFVNCFYLEAIPAYDFSKVTNLGLCFTSLHNLKEIHCFGMSASFDLSSCFSNVSTSVAHDAILEVFNNLGEVDKTAGITLTLGSGKLALMSDEEKKIATDKGWTLA